MRVSSIRTLILTETARYLLEIPPLLGLSRILCGCHFPSPDEPLYSTSF